MLEDAIGNMHDMKPLNYRPSGKIMVDIQLQISRRKIIQNNKYFMQTNLNHKFYLLIQTSTKFKTNR